jgi:maltose O-acetyltransferase
MSTVSLTPFNPAELQHRAARTRAKKLCVQLNTFSVNQTKARQPLYRELFGNVSRAFIEPDFFCDYGHNIFLGDNFFANHHCVMLDAATIHIGDRVLLGPSVHLYTTTHPLDAEERASGRQLIAPIVLEDDCWIGGNSIIMPGVTIGRGAVIGAGSVVTKSIPAGAVAFGNPCKVQQIL